MYFKVSFLYKTCLAHSFPAHVIGLLTLDAYLPNLDSASWGSARQILEAQTSLLISNKILTRIVNFHWKQSLKLKVQAHATHCIIWRLQTSLVSEKELSLTRLQKGRKVKQKPHPVRLKFFLWTILSLEFIWKKGKMTDAIPETGTDDWLDFNVEWWSLNDGEKRKCNSDTTVSSYMQMLTDFEVF